jgi:hypothetical protein
MPVKGTVLIKSKTNAQNPNKTHLLKKNYAINLIHLTHKTYQITSIITTQGHSVPFFSQCHSLPHSQR